MTAETEQVQPQFSSVQEALDYYAALPAQPLTEERRQRLLSLLLD